MRENVFAQEKETVERTLRVQATKIASRLYVQNQQLEDILQRIEPTPTTAEADRQSKEAEPLPLQHALDRAIQLLENCGYSIEALIKRIG